MKLTEIPQRPFDAYIFDCDGTLADTMGLHYEAWQIVLEPYGHYHALLPKVQPIESVVSIARSMHGKKPMAVASGGGRHSVHATLDRLGLGHLFDTIVTSEDYKRGKPFPDPYLEAARRLGVSPSECLVFEDTEIGRQSAIAAGMECVLVDSRQRPQSQRV